MAVDMFINIDGIKGESKDSKHKGEIDVLAWSWGLSNSGTFHMGGGGGAGKCSMQDLSFTKYVDAGSADLQLACANGKHLKSAKLVVRKAGENPLEYIIIELTELLVTSVSTGGSGGEDRLTENVTLNFEEVHFTYWTQDDKGKKGDSTEYKYNMAENVKK
jgi:type VI secretion system secreted protein Hcp